MNNYCATFYTHYGAMKFNKLCNSLQITAKLAPVPRKISASCTTCVFFSAESHDFVNDDKSVEDLDSCYTISGDNYIKLIR